MKANRAVSPRRRRRVELYCHTFAADGYPALPEYIEPALSPVSRPDVAADFPLVLTNAKNTTFVHSQQRALTSLRKALPEPSADVHPETALRYGIKNKQWMIVESPRGAIKVKARVTTNIVPGVICVQHGWWQGCKELELPGYDPYEYNGANRGHADRHRPRRPDQRLAAAPVVSVQSAAGDVNPRARLFQSFRSTDRK